MKILLNTKFANDILDVIRLFYPNEVFELCSDKENCDLFFNTEELNGIEVYTCRTQKISALKRLEMHPAWTEIEKKRYTKRISKLCIYECLKELTGTDMPWGALTGVRPTKLARELEQAGRDAELTFTKDLFVTKEKTALTLKTLQNQKDIINTDEKSVGFFVNIPFCMTRCAYCSFVTGDMKTFGHLTEQYTDALIKEIRHAKLLVNRLGLTVASVYIGGGTPTALSLIQLERILDELRFNVSESTVEAGRPDSLSEDKLKLLKNKNVTRISINPQTFKQSTLDLIGRKHTINDIVYYYNASSRLCFNINMDLIAGLPNEFFEDFRYSLSETVNLNPENITVHSLALKAGSKLKEGGAVVKDEEEVKKMIDFAGKFLEESGYAPYYLYRQKYVSGNLENVGYCKPQKQCKYNIDMMEESASIIACGSNAISKRIFPGQNRIERAANVKDIDGYISRIDEMLMRKEILFK